MYQIHGHTISYGDNSVRFKFPVRESIPPDDNLIVLLDIPAENPTTDNICCLNSDLKIVWWTSPLKEKYPNIKICPYEDMILDDGLLIAFDFLCRRFEIDPKTGEVLRYTFSK